MPHPLYRIEPNGTVSILCLRLPSFLDPSEIDSLNQSILGEIDAHPTTRWVLDLSESSYLGSAMLGMLVNLRHQIRATGGRLVLCGLSPQLEDVIHACSMDRLFDISSTRSAAMRDL